MVSIQKHEHARDDAKTSNDLARVGATSTILINGGAASATLAFIGSMARDTDLARVVLPLLPVPLFAYCLGVFFAATSLLVMSKAIEFYMLEWLGDAESSSLAAKLWLIGLTLVALGLLCFIVASSYLACKLGQIHL